jgi:hypothetical protein
LWRKTHDAGVPTIDRQGLAPPSLYSVWKQAPLPNMLAFDARPGSVRRLRAAPYAAAGVGAINDVTGSRRAARSPHAEASETGKDEQAWIDKIVHLTTALPRDEAKLLADVYNGRQFVRRP